MVVNNFDRREIGDRMRVTAEIHWEDIDRKSEEIYYEVDKQFSGYISDGVEPFFLATLIPALFYGEQRYKIDDEICPYLLEGVKDVLEWLNLWYYKNTKSSIKLNVKTKTHEILQEDHRHAASFFTGGIDSLQTLVENRSIYNESHPGYIKDGIIAFALDIDDPEKFNIVESVTREYARKLNLSLITVYTNIYLIYRNEDAKNHYSFWRNQFQGAALASIGHFLSNKINAVNIAATYDLKNLEPYGSHPVIDPNYSSYRLRVRHCGLSESRLEKLKQLSQHFTELEDLRVCNQFEKVDSKLKNCGECEKCIRTMLELIALGKLKDSSIFPSNNVTPEMIIRHQLKDNYERSCYSELLKPLEKAGRPDLVSVVRYIISRYDNRERFIKLFFIKIDYHFIKKWFFKSKR